MDPEAASLEPVLTDTSPELAKAVLPEDSLTLPVDVDSEPSWTSFHDDELTLTSPLWEAELPLAEKRPD
jgi:hypothetical protein